MATLNSSKVQVDNVTRICLAAITVLMVVMVLTLWVQTPSTSAQAAEEFLNTASQRQEQIDAQKATNAKLDELITLFKSGTVKVQVAKEDGDKHDAK